MPRLPRHLVDQIYQATDIVEVIGDYVELKRAGRDYKGLSPFKQERTPSFYVSPQKGIFKDFSSGLGGTAISFLMEIEGLTYREALERLAARYNIDLTFEGSDEDASEQSAARAERERLKGVLKFAAAFFQQQLQAETTEGAKARAYLEERDFGPETVARFQLGYAPDQWSALMDHAKKHQVATADLEALGLIARSENTGRTYDRFRGRIIFPLHNDSGEIAGFAGRILNKEAKAAKYINSPESLLYDKSSLLYGIYFGKLAIRDAQKVFLTEGYTDVIRLHEAGIRNVAASSGTSFTQQQTRLLKRFAKEVILLFDGDDAGLKAAERALETLLPEGLEAKVMLLPPEHDPDSYVHEHGAEAFRELVDAEAQNFADFLLERFRNGEPLAEPQVKTRVIRSMAEVLARLPDAVQRAVYIEHVAKTLGVEAMVVQTEVGFVQERTRRQAENRQQQAQQQPAGPTPAPAPPKAKRPLSYEKERELLRLMMNYFEEEIELPDDIEEASSNTGKAPATHSEYLVGYLMDELEGIEFATPALETIRQEVTHAFEAHRPLPVDSLVNEYDDAVRQETIDLLSPPEALSERWGEHSIVVQPLDYDLKKTTQKTINHFKLRHILKLIDESHQKLQAAEDPAEQQQLMITRLKLDQARSQLRAQDIVILPR